MSDKTHPAILLFSEKHPLTSMLDLKFITDDSPDLRVEVDAPESFADEHGEHIHTGFHTLLLDTVLGSCAIGNLETMQPIATMKLSCNHMRKVKIGEPLHCTARWSGEENSISYVNGEIRRISDDVVISEAIGTFMIGTTGRPLDEKA
ncbi:MAG: PaaI family thioesterase [Pseudomonadota bacterium]